MVGHTFATRHMQHRLSHMAGGGAAVVMLQLIIAAGTLAIYCYSCLSNNWVADDRLATGHVVSPAHDYVSCMPATMTAAHTDRQIVAAFISSMTCGRLHANDLWLQMTGVSQWGQSC